MMREVAESRQEVLLLKREVQRLKKQLALAEKQVAEALAAHLPDTGDDYDDSFEAVRHGLSVRWLFYNTHTPRPRCRFFGKKCG